MLSRHLSQHGLGTSGMQGGASKPASPSSLPRPGWRAGDGQRSRLRRGSGGILGPNEYTLQVNTNFTGTTSACAGHTGCTVWQQFIYSPDYEVKGEAAFFMQYWLIGWGSPSF